MREKPVLSFRGRRVPLYIPCQLLIIFALAMLNCSDDGATTPEVDSGVDARVDLGPIECDGPPQSENSRCLKGQLYDLLTDQPIGVAEQLDIINVDSQWFLDPSTFPEPTTGFIREDGRFATWETRDDQGYQYGDMLVIPNDVPGYVSGAVNIYSDMTYDRWEPRVYLISNYLLNQWSINYPGEADISTFRPLILALLMGPDYSELSGDYIWRWGLGGAPGFDDLGLFWEATEISADGTGFEDGTDHWNGVSPESGIAMLLLDQDNVIGPGIRFYNTIDVVLSLPYHHPPSSFEDGTISYVILHYCTWYL